MERLRTCLLIIHLKNEKQIPIIIFLNPHLFYNSCGTAKHFAAEQSQDKLFTQCCCKGKVLLERVKVAPVIQALMTSQHEH